MSGRTATASGFQRPTWLGATLACLVVGFMLAPLLVVIPMSFSASRSFAFPPPSYSLIHYRTYFTSRAWLIPTLNSAGIAFACSLLTMLITLPAAFAINRRDFLTRRLCQVLLLLPMLVPSIVMAISYYTIFGSMGLLHNYLGILLAHTCISIPVALIALSPSVRGFDRSLERAAAAAGASPMQIFLHVTLPLLRPAFIVAAVFAFVHSFDETVISLFIAGAGVDTLPRRMFESIRLDSDPVIAVVSTLIMGFVVLVFLGVSLLRRWGPSRLQTATP